MTLSITERFGLDTAPPSSPRQTWPARVTVRAVVDGGQGRDHIAEISVKNATELRSLREVIGAAVVHWKGRLESKPRGPCYCPVTSKCGQGIELCAYNQSVLCTCPARSEYDPPCPRHGFLGIGVKGDG